MSSLTEKDLLNVSPETARKLFRAGEFFCIESSDVCEGYLQTNLLGLHKSMAEDFAKFCEANRAPLPVIFQSGVGQFTAPAITQTDSDARTDLSAYYVIEKGEVNRVVKNVLEFGEILDDFVFFYTGCSFSFHKPLLDAGIPHRSFRSINAYTTNIDCYPVGPYRCKMVVSMRAIPRDLLETTFKVTHEFPDCHGAPVHIGDPALIGIPDLSRPNYEIRGFTPIEDDVPVFWACGITDVEAMKSAKPAIAVSQAQGLYIADEPSHVRRIKDGSSASIKVISLTEDSYWASVISEANVHKIKQLEGFITEDMDKQQIDNLVFAGGLLKSALALSHASCGAVVAGLPGNNTNGCTEVLAAVAVVMMLQALGKKVDLVVDKALYEPLTAQLEKSFEQKVLSRPISVVQFPPEGEQATLETAQRFLVKAGDGSPRYDHLLRPSPSKAVNDLCILFAVASALPTVTTSSVINYERCDIISRYIKEGCSDSPSHFKVSSSVPSWGFYAVAVALYLVSTCPIHERYKRRGVGFPPSVEDRKRFKAALPDVEREEKLLRILIDHEIGDVRSPDVHAEKIQQLLGVVEDE